MTAGSVSPRELIKPIALVAGAGLAMALVMLLIDVPLWNHIALRRSQMREIDANIAEAVLLNRQQAQYEHQRDGTQRRFHAVEQRLARGQSLAHVLELLSQQAQAHRLQLSVLQPHSDEQEKLLWALGRSLTVREIPLTLHLSGRYRQVGGFLGALREMPFLSSVRALTMQHPEANATTLQTEVALSVYVVEGERLP